jgi:large subunit ribosomal protein L6
MSKIGKKPITVPAGVTAEEKAGFIVVKGKGGEIKVSILPYCSITISDAADGKEMKIAITSEERQARANWGTMAALLRNAVSGVTAGYEKKLQLEGIGYRASVEGKSVVLALGFSHPVNFPLPEGISAAVAKNIITISGINKEVVGKIAADIRKLKKPEPYQGKGIRYVGEFVRRKAGKKAAAAGAKA